MKPSQQLNSNCCSLHGNLFLPFQLQKVFAGTNTHQEPKAYAIPNGVTLKEECSRGFNIARAEWVEFNKQQNRTDITETQRLANTTHFVKQLLSFSLGYQLKEVDPIFVPYMPDRKTPEDRFFPVTLLANEIPVAIVDSSHSLDERHPCITYTNGDTFKKTAFQIIQELINGVSDYVWGFVSNGLTLRLVHKITFLTIPCYVEFNLEEMFSGGDYAEFFHMWELLHASRTKKNPKGQNVWDQWVTEGVESGQPAREALSANLEQALQILGEGFINTEGNEALLARLQARPNTNILATNNNQVVPLTAQEYQHELLLLIYRFLFVFCLEERKILNTFIKDSPENELARQRYLEGYAFHRFIEPSRKLRFQNEHHDAWDSVVLVLKSLENGEPRLALPALGVLFKADRCQDLMTAKLSNQYLFQAMEKMRWAVINGSLTTIDYKNMDTEELGSIYEGLLELIPEINFERMNFSFAHALGNERKSSGSYYTPDFLVQSLIKTALDPVIKQKLETNPNAPEKALLSLKVIDPACGSGHFLLAAARRIAKELADIRAGNDVVTPEIYRSAMHDVVKNCIYGVDLNPMAIELTKIALWLEGFAEGTPLSFLDHHIKVGNALLGVLDLDSIKLGIPDDAYVVTDKDIEAEFNLTQSDVCKRLKAVNKKARDNSVNKGLLETVPLFEGSARKVELSFSKTDNEQLKEKLYLQYQATLQKDPKKIACDLYIAAFLSPKTQSNEYNVPTSNNLFKFLYSPDSLQANDFALAQKATEVCEQNHVFHWSFEFPEVYNGDDVGFDCVLGNPPWEKPKVEDEKWFAAKENSIVNAKTAAIRKKMLKALSQGEFGSTYLDITNDEIRIAWEKDLYKQYAQDKHAAGAFSSFGHLRGESARFPLTGVGDTNLYAYFSELAKDIRKETGTAGLVLPLGILTDNATQAFSRKILNGQVISGYSFINTEHIFKDVFDKCTFVLLTLQKSDLTDFVFYATNIKDLDVAERHVHFEADDFKLINPNTETCLPVRSETDLQLCRKIYKQAPILLNTSKQLEINPWHIKTMRMFDMANDSNLFHTSKDNNSLVPLYEGKFFHQFDHRWSTLDTSRSKDTKFMSLTQEEKEQPSFLIQTRYWVDFSEVNKKLSAKEWTQHWMLVWRGIGRATDERTLIATVLPANVGSCDKSTLLFPFVSDKTAACLLAILNSLTVDYVLRIKHSSANVNLFILLQLPILPPEAFKEEDVEFICKRVAMLTRTADDINAVWLTDYPCYTFQKPVERLKIRAELDAYIARMYGLTRDELRYVLDPSDVKGDNFPSETFPSLKKKQIKEFGEYITQRLVLEAFDKLEAGTLTEQSLLLVVLAQQI